MSEAAQFLNYRQREALIRMEGRHGLCSPGRLCPLTRRGQLLGREWRHESITDFSVRQSEPAALFDQGGWWRICGSVLDHDGAVLPQRSFDFVGVLRRILP